MKAVPVYYEKMSEVEQAIMRHLAVQRGRMTRIAWKNIKKYIPDADQTHIHAWTMILRYGAKNRIFVDWAGRTWKATDIVIRHNGNPSYIVFKRVR